MILIDAQGLGASRPNRPLFTDLSLTLSDGDRVGVVGLNGSGKSTLLAMMSGDREPDAEEFSAVQRTVVQLQLRVRSPLQRRLVHRSQLATLFGQRSTAERCPRKVRRRFRHVGIVGDEPAQRPIGAVRDADARRDNHVAIGHGGIKTSHA